MLIYITCEGCGGEVPVDVETDEQGRVLDFWVDEICDCPKAQVEQAKLEELIAELALNKKIEQAEFLDDLYHDR